MTVRRPPWAIPIRRWLLVALVLVFVLPVAITGFVAFNFVFNGRDGGDAGSIRSAEALLREGSGRWTDPAWQAQTKAALADGGIDAVLFVSGTEVFRTSAEPLAGTEAPEDRGPWWEAAGGRAAYLLDVPGSDPPQTAYVYGPMVTGDYPWQLPLVGVATLLLVLMGIGWAVGRLVVGPLAATGRAARSFATGDFEAELPSSRVREIAEVHAAFDALRAGLSDSTRQQAALEQERRLFISAVAHDLRTPLFSLRGYLEGLEQGVANTPEKRARYLAVAQEKAASLERLVSDLFDYTRLEYLELAPARESLDLAVLLANSAEAARPRAASQGVTVSVDTAAGCPVDADPHLLARAVENLLDNALRYTPAGGRIRLACRVDAGTARFSVEDSGPGILPEDLPHLFEPLYRGDPARSRESGGGAGLGLTIARRVLVAHGGSLTAANAPDGGAIFTATLPAHPPSHGADGAKEATLVRRPG